MTIYFAASIAGGRSHLDTYRRMVTFLQSRGITVPTVHIIAEDVLQRESLLTPVEIYRRDVAWLTDADALIAEISNPSLGVGYEIGYALELKKPVLCVFKQGLFISRMIVGNDRPGLTLAGYTAEDDWRRQIERFLSTLAESRR